MANATGSAVHFRTPCASCTGTFQQRLHRMPTCGFGRLGALRRNLNQQQHGHHCTRQASRHLRVCAAKTTYDNQDKIKAARGKQLAATDLLAQLLQAPRPEVVAAEQVDSLTEEFFHISGTYLEMARKEGNPEVVGKLETALRVAMAEKQKTLRPEIQLLNQLIAAPSRDARQQVLSAPESPQQLAMNDRYFFSLLDRMLADVKRQPDNPNKQQLLAQLSDIKDDATARLAAAG